ncbi:MAG TPA: polysaccharide biosynthesis/export family protein [Vicinamibacterales bacterium]|jgi:polysaccharide export outer membrane protein|nr:polysaccharide biosynthesis/export family protein [Vicinamibacterales bacterium]
MTEQVHRFHRRFLGPVAISAAMAVLPALAHAQTPGQTQTPFTDAYRVGAGDKLRISVYKDPTSSLDSVQVRPDGKITMPLIGDIQASGRTSEELRDSVTNSLKTYMTNPSVTVIVLEATASTAFVLGEVNHSGTVPILGNMTVLQALAVAGGLKDFADAKNIRILRKGVTGTQTIRFNYKDAIKGQGSNPMLKAGDIVVVPD